jgi:hypothetical protein
MRPRADQTAAWTALRTLFDTTGKNFALREAFAADPRRFESFSQSRAQAPPPSAEELAATSEEEAATPAAVKEDRNQRKVAKYVQDEVRLQADIVWFVINAIDGRIFVCGSTKGMGEGVSSALIDVAMDKGNLDFETATQFWEQKKKDGQYIAETW